MTESTKCPTCGSPLASAADGAICPICLIRGALSDPDGTVEGEQLEDRALDSPDQPKQIGPYAILETLGQGGMGIVYLAEQAAPIRRKVALKLVKLGTATKNAIARFDAERQALALMDHPNIASVFDAGTTPDGRSYFVMEYVPGVPITEFCDAHQLSTRARLELLQQVCAAVQHAHQKGIIHRDLKPSNILVMNQDERPLPKVIDFGVARATDRALAERAMFTEHGILIGTPEYMSPEQAGAHADEVDTRTDIYSLGVLLYELLVGGVPFTSTQLRRAGYAELWRIIRDAEPSKPSTKISELGAIATDVAARRRTTVSTLIREVRGDLDWITLKAIDKDPNRRYASASELAADISRHLAQEPVDAGPPNASYRARKFVRKHRGAVIAAATVLAVLTAGLIATTALYLRSERFADEGRHESYRNALLAADLSLEAGEMAQARQRLQSVDPRLRGWEWGYLNRTADSSIGATSAFSLDVQQVTILSDNQTVLALGVQPEPDSFRRYRTSLTRIAFGAAAVTFDPPLGEHLVAMSPDGRRAVWGTWSEAANWSCNYQDDPVVCMPSGLRAGRFGPPEVRQRLVVTDTSTGGTIATIIDPDLGIWSGRRRESTKDRRHDPLFGSVEGMLREVGVRLPTAVGAAFNANGSRLATWSNGYVIHLWDVAGQSEFRVLHGHTDTIRSFAFDGTGERAVSTSFDGTVRVWTVASGNQLQSIPVNGAATAAIAPNGVVMAIGTDAGEIELWDLSEKRAIRTLDGHKGSVGLLAFSPDSTRLVSAADEDRSAFLWDVSTGLQVQAFVGHDKGISSVSYSPNGDSVATGGKDGTVRMWSARGAAILGYTRAARALRFTPSGDALVSAGWDQTVRVWDLKAGQSSPVYSHPDVGIPADAVVALTAATGAMKEVPEIDTTLRLTSNRVMSLPVESRNRQVAISSDGSSLAVAGADKTGSIVAVWGGPSWRPLATWRVENYFPLFSSRIGLSRDGRRVAVWLSAGQRATREGPHGRLFVFDRGSTKPLAAIPTSFMALEPTFLPDADRLVVVEPGVGAQVGLGARASRIRIWDIRAQAEAAVLDGPNAVTVYVAVTPDGSRIVAAGDTDQAVYVWDAVRRELLLTIRLSRQPHEIAFSPDGNRIAVLFQDGTIQILEADLADRPSRSAARPK